MKYTKLIILAGLIMVLLNTSAYGGKNPINNWNFTITNIRVDGIMIYAEIRNDSRVKETSGDVVVVFLVDGKRFCTENVGIGRGETSYAGCMVSTRGVHTVTIQVYGGWGNTHQFDQRSKRLRFSR